MTDTDAMKLIGQLASLAELAKANFPASTDMRLEIARTGGTAAGSITFSVYTLNRVLELANRALSAEQPK